MAMILTQNDLLQIQTPIEVEKISWDIFHDMLVVVKYGSS